MRGDAILLIISVILRFARDPSFTFCDFDTVAFLSVLVSTVVTHQLVCEHAKWLV